MIDPGQGDERERERSADDAGGAERAEPRERHRRERHARSRDEQEEPRRCDGERRHRLADAESIEVRRHEERNEGSLGGERARPVKTKREGHRERGEERAEDDEGSLRRGEGGDWTAGPKLAHERDHHVTFVATTPAGSFLYVVGGAGAGGTVKQIERATIADNGTLGAFSDAARMPEGVLGCGLAQVERSFMIGGGLGDDSNSKTSVYVGQIADDGGVSFTKGPDLGASRYHVRRASLRDGRPLPADRERRADAEDRRHDRARRVRWQGGLAVGVGGAAAWAAAAARVDR